MTHKSNAVGQVGLVGQVGRVRDVIHQRFSVAFAYRVHFTRGVFRRDNALLARTLVPRGAQPARALVLLDDGLVCANPRLARDVQRYVQANARRIELVCPPVTVPGGEAAKAGWENVRRVMTLLGDHHLCRHSYVIAVGGGSMLDMAGFAAAIVHRGIRLVRLPTTVLAMGDGGVGVKNGMDEHGMKNFVGTFAPPFAVINDLAFLRTLPPRYRTGGLSEAFKVAIIRDRAFFNWLEAHAAELRRGQAGAVEAAVRRMAELHLRHIRTSGDPFEFGEARPLDFGHWAAHRLEMLSGHELGHGEAVAIGIALDTCYAWRAGMLPARDADRILVAMRSTGLPLWHPALDAMAGKGRPALLRGLDEFREHLGGRLTVTLPLAIGRAREVHAMDAALVLAARDELRAAFSR